MKVYRNLLLSIVVLNFLFLYLCIENLSISQYEAHIFFNDKSIASYLSNLSCFIFSNNDFALRIPFLIFHFFNIILVYKISKIFLKHYSDILLSVFIYSFLPSVLAGAIVVGNFVIIIFITLLIIYYEKKSNYLVFNALLFVSVFVDKSFIILYSAVLLYKIYQKDAINIFFAMFLILLSLFLYDFDIRGKPSGFFLDTIGVFAASFSPIIFMFFIYAIYRILVKEQQKEFIWFVSFFSFISCLSLSFRQRQELELFLPFCVVCIPLIIKIFSHSMRSKLKEFRRIYLISALVGVLSLIFIDLIVLSNQFLYLNLYKNNPKKHFIYKFDIVKDLSTQLKKNNIYYINSDDSNLLNRLRFYGIYYKKNAPFLSEGINKKCKRIIAIKKFEKELFYYCIY